MYNSGSSASYYKTETPLPNTLVKAVTDAPKAVSSAYMNMDVAYEILDPASYCECVSAPMAVESVSAKAVADKEFKAVKSLIRK